MKQTNKKLNHFISKEKNNKKNISTKLIERKISKFT